jgi:NhaA family Na+:H+ antiporter
MSAWNALFRWPARAFRPHRALRAAQAFMETEAAGGIVLLAATVVALAWVNSPWGDAYSDLWKTVIGVDLGFASITEDLRQWVNDGLMTLFFFVVGLEIKRELVHGELSDHRKAALPALAAAGGMIGPALIYTAFNAGSGDGHGWGIPMATDIAFAIGTLSLLGSRAPFGAKIFLLALAIADDIGSIAIIAIFYSGSLSLGALGIALALFAGIVLMNRLGLRNVNVYVVLGVAAWVAMVESGVTPTILGVALGLLTPARSYYDSKSYVATARGLLGRYEEAFAANEKDAQEDLLGQVEDLTQGSEAVLERLERFLHPWVSFLVLPVFALANAGVGLSGGVIGDAFGSPVTQGILAGRVLGKLAGILAFTYLGVRLGLGRLPEGVAWRHVFGVGLVASVGFTVSLFVTDLAFADLARVSDAKIGLFAASLLAGVLGVLFFWIAGRKVEGEG